ncbi:hypothetical protein SADUNF_Sadunf18G0085000 [Salix dunnii]|uniref:Uncharacterized protein n=1 Tax=Salix dunnii TaxID=1413687 RepID=A0A835J538_9ROSI|nr:hypothetical protein SADUNF_Sadunf18G0085000 [Salix dunnii]
MKKMKGVAAAAAMNSPSPSYATIYEDPRIMLKHQSLMQDYEELYKETEAKKRKLQMMRQKKLTLMAEVRFLRRRYKFLTQNKSKKAPKERSFVQPQNLVAASKNLKKEKSYSVNNAALRPPVPRFDLNQKGKVCIEREAILRNSTPIFDLNQKQMTHIGKEAALRKTATIPDLNQKERIYRGKEAKVQNNTPIFDLNEISREEEELQVNGDMLRAEELKIISVKGGGDELNNDMKLSACRNVGNGSSRAGKRKITWQDQSIDNSLSRVMIMSGEWRWREQAIRSSLLLSVEEQWPLNMSKFLCSGEPVAYRQNSHWQSKSKKGRNGKNDQLIDQSVSAWTSSVNLLQVVYGFPCLRTYWMESKFPGKVGCWIDNVKSCEELLVMQMEEGKKQPGF